MTSSKFSFSSTFNWEDSNLRALIKPIEFQTQKHNDVQQPFCHFNHKNLGTKMAPYRSQHFTLYLPDLINVKYLSIDNYTHAAQLTISIAYHPTQPFTQVYQDKYICKGKTLKQQKKLIDLGALPCRAIKISVGKGSRISANNLKVLGIASSQIQDQLGDEYFKLLVINPMKIIYSQ